LALQDAHEADGAQEPQDDPSPAITPSAPMAQNSEIALRTRSLPQFGQGIGASASDIARSASNRVSQS